MNVDLTPQLEQYVQGKVASGQYKDAGEVLCAALREKMAREPRHERAQAAKRAWLRGAIQEGLDSPVEPMEELDTLVRPAQEKRATGEAG
jgi:antitoxin ParD1/3/4